MQSEPTSIPTATMRFLHDTQTIPNDAKSTGLQVIAAGQWRCATSSLQTAFETILDPPLAPSMHGAYLMPRPHLIALLNIATHEQDKEKRQAILTNIYQGYNASSDWPGFAFLEDLLELYPDCRVILNKRRSAEDWRKSCKESLEFFSTRTYHWITYWLPQCYQHHKLYTTYTKLAKKRYGVDDIFSTDCCERHNQWVRDVCAARGKEVLEWRPDDGWGPLCRFIGRPVPKVPFPRTNETEEIEKLKWVLLKQGMVAWAKVVSAVGVGVGVLWGLRLVIKG